MNIPITTPALLFPAIAILMLGFINRYLGTATVIRNFKKDFDSGYKHTDIIKQIKILSKRIELSRYMLTIGAAALMFACLSMFLIFEELQDLGNIAFGASIILIIASLILSLYETSLSNKSILIEVEHILDSESKRKS